MIIVRHARLSDVPRMMPLLDEFARHAEILPRTEEDVYRSIREWVVAETNVKVVGMASLLVMWRDLAEVRSLVISPECQGQGVGRRLVETLVDDARQLRIPRIFALTRKPGFFLKLGFKLTHIEKLPRKVKRDCVFCPKFHVCDEAAVELWLNKASPQAAVEPPRDEEINSTEIIPLVTTRKISPHSSSS